jgi:FkbM family methyltransferase
MHLTARHRLGLLAIVVLTLAATGAVFAARSDRYAPYWTDARTAVTLDNPLCSPISAYNGLVKARTVAARASEIQGLSRYVGEVDGLHLYQTPSGNIWMPQPNDLWSLATVLAEQEQEVYGAGRLGVQPGDVVIDAGAHVGLFTRTALAAGASKVVTFEVTPNAVRALRRNLEKEIADGRVVVVDKGVWFEEGTMPLVVVEGCSACNSVSHPQLMSAFEVPLTTIDRAVEDLHLERVDFIKLDIENAEANALRGAQNTLAAFRPRVAVALENSKARIAYSYEVLGLMRETAPGYEYECGSCTNPATAGRVLPEILHFYPR